MQCHLSKRSNAPLWHREECIRRACGLLLWRNMWRDLLGRARRDFDWQPSGRRSPLRPRYSGCSFIFVFSTDLFPLSHPTDQMDAHANISSSH